MKYILLALALFILHQTKAQDADWMPFVREVVVSHKDSVERANILIKPPDIKLEDELTYYWFKKDVINVNMGGYTGHLLHGEYLVFDTDKKLITKGSFETGLKNGTWRYWFPNGNLRRVENWKEGKLDGSFKIYAPSGGLTEEIEYRNGIKVSPENKLFHIIKSNKEAGADSTKSENE